MTEIDRETFTDLLDDLGMPGWEVTLTVEIVNGCPRVREVIVKAPEGEQIESTSWRKIKIGQLIKRHGANRVGGDWHKRRKTKQRYEITQCPECGSSHVCILNHIETPARVSDPVWYLKCQTCGVSFKSGAAVTSLEG
jgi:ribosomal protein L37AE/L43A|tara:strand:- start:457 stop:870 length:414 start_codon:yes stop_codon:yes gene_type:complete